MALPVFRLTRVLGGLDGSIAARLDGVSAAFLPEFQQFRGRKRNLKKPLSRQEKLARRLKREEKEAARKQFSFMERIKIRKMKKL